MSTLIETLRLGRERVARPGGWTQDVFARDKDGNKCPPGLKRAVSWCAVGAVNDDLVARDRLQRALCWTVVERLVEWNDAPERTQQDVIDLYDAAISEAERSGGE